LVAHADAIQLAKPVAAAILFLQKCATQYLDN
jgi:hypothetical protein